MFVDDQSENSTPPSNTDMFKDQLSVIKNEDGNQKYDSVDKALEALKHSQEFIEQLKRDNADLTSKFSGVETELSKRSEIEDVVSKLLQGKSEPTSPVEQGTPPAQTLDENSIKSLVESVLANKGAQQSAESNKQKVANAFVERFGTNAKSKFDELARETDMTPEQLQQLSEKSPAMVLKLLPTSSSSPRVSVGGYNTSGFVDSSEEEFTGKLAPPETSILSGATSKDLKAEMLRHKVAVYKRHNVEV